MECSNKKEQEILLEIAEKGQKEKIKTFFEAYTPKKSDIDLAIRKCISKFITNKINYSESIKELFKHADLNYSNPEFENTNILMEICIKGEISLFELLFDQKYLNNSDNKKNINKANKNLKENNTYIEIDLNKVDNNNNNLFHYLFNNKRIENGVISIINKIMNYKGNNNNKIYSLDKKKSLLTHPNNNGITPIVIILRNGWFDSLCLIFKYIDYQKYIIPCTNNNLIHCAIEGKNIKCIKKILSYCNSTDELKYKNKDGYTPLLYANKYKLNLVEKIIEQTEKSFYNKQLKNAILSTKGDDIYSILEKYIIIQNNSFINNNNIEEIKNNITKDYIIVINNLYKYKINQYILSSDYISLPCEWNILFIQIQYEQILNFINNNKNNKSIISHLKEISNFFEKQLKIYETKKLNEDINYSIDITIYNKIIYHYKICDYSSLFSTINYYFNNIYKENKSSNNYYAYICYVNISFILIEYFIFDNDEKISSILLEQLEYYLINNYPNKKNYNENNIIIKYLNNNEIYNPFNPTWDDAFCYLNLLKSLYHIKYNKNLNNDNNEEDEDSNEVKQYLKEFKKGYNNCNYKEELVNFNRLNGFYTINKCYYYYLINNINKSLYKISLIKKSLYEYSNEYKMFYYNSLGIINLKLKNYENAEYYFKTGINLFKKIVNNNNPNDDVIFYRIDYLIKMKYNLCLALFYNKKYYEAYLIFTEIQNFDIIKNNTYFWYRYGLTSLNLYLNLIKNINNNKQKEKQNNIIYKNKLNININNGTNENKSNDSQKEKDDLYIEFEKEYGNKNRINIEENNLENNSDYRYNNKIFIDLGINKKVLDKTIIDKDKNVMKEYKIKNNLDNKNNNNNTIENYLLTSINCFKKTILLFKRPQFVVKRNKKMFDEIKSILNFYIKNDDSEQNELINKIITNESESIYNYNDLNISENSLFTNCYMNLLFSLSLNEKYSEILLLIKAFPKNILNDNINLKNNLNYYKLSSLLNLSKYEEVEKIIEENKKINENKKENNIYNPKYKFDCFNINNFEIEKNMSHKSYLLLAEIILNCKLKKYENAEKNINKLINMNYCKNNNISKYYTQLMIYILSLQNKKRQTINLIKYRWNNLQKKTKINNDIINYSNKNG